VYSKAAHMWLGYVCHSNVQSYVTLQTNAIAKCAALLFTQAVAYELVHEA
jgi:hypothetical protein